MSNATPAQLAIATLYSAAFNRAPDAAGFDFWLQAYQQGATLSGLAGTFLGTPEGQTAYPPGMTSEAFVAAFYSSVFGRPVDAGGLQFWSASLDALGGAGSPGAKAALMANIIGIASTPLTAKPDGLSDEAYAQTVADRARFLNKAEVGVYFAAELRSNDLSLAKQVLAGVTADPASVTAARTLADQAINPPVTPPVTPPVVVPALTSADDVAAITNKLAAYGGTAASADTSGMDAAQLKAIAAGLSKFKADGLTGALSLSSTVTALESSGLLTKYSGTTASANAVGMDANQLAVLASASTKLAAGGISGTFALAGNLDATQLTALLGKLDASARVTADVSSMQASQLAVLAAQPLALNAGALTGTLNLSVPLTGTAVAVLLNRYAGTDASLLATGAGSDVLNAAAATLGKVASISGGLAILSDVLPAYGLILLAKYVGASATVNASLYNSAQLESLSGSLTKLAAIAEPSLTVADAWLTSTMLNQFLLKSTDAKIDTTSASGAHLTALFSRLDNLAVDGITGSLAVPSVVTAAMLETLFQKTATAATVSVTASFMSVDQLVVLFANAGKIDSVTNLSIPSGAWARLPVDFGTLFTKGTGILADVSGASVAQLKLVTQFSGQYATGGLTGTFALDQGFSAAQLGALLGDRVNATADVTVNAVSMSLDQVVALFANAANVDHLSNLSAPSGTMAQIGTNFGLLFTKGIGNAVDLTGATAQQLGVIGQFVNTFKADGLTGSFTITKDVAVGYFPSLSGDRVADAANLTVQATDLSTAQLAAVVQGIGKVDTILGLSLTDANTAGLSSTNIAGLLTKVSGVDASSLNSTTLADALTFIADGVVKGTVAIGSAQLLDVGVSRLENKLATTATLSVTGTGSNDVIDLSGFSKQTYAVGGAGVDTITLGSGKGTVFIGGKDDSRSAFDSTQSTSANIDKIAGLKSGDVIKLSTEANAYGTGIHFTAATNILYVQQMNQDLGSGSATFDSVYAALNGTSIAASSSTEASLLVFTLTSPAGLSGKFLIVNDGNAAITADDTIIELIGATSGLVYTV